MNLDFVAFVCLCWFSDPPPVLRTIVSEVSLGFLNLDALPLPLLPQHVCVSRPRRTADEPWNNVSPPPRQPASLQPQVTGAAAGSTRRLGRGECIVCGRFSRRLHFFLHLIRVAKGRKISRNFPWVVKMGSFGNIKLRGTPRAVRYSEENKIVCIVIHKHLVTQWSLLVLSRFFKLDLSSSFKLQISSYSH